MFGSLAVQNDAAETDPPSEIVNDTPVYLFLDYGAGNTETGLRAAYRDPSTRSSVAGYIDAVVGNPAVADALLKAAEKHGVDPALVVALCRQESRFNPRASGVNKNRTVDRGIMQLNSSTFSHLTEDDFYDPVLNADLGVGYLRKTLDLSGNAVAALAMYNAGPGRVGSLGAPKVTLDYISKILAYREQLIRDYRELYAGTGILVTVDAHPVKDPDLL